MTTELSEMSDAILTMQKVCQFNLCASLNQNWFQATFKPNELQEKQITQSMLLFDDRQYLEKEQNKSLYLLRQGNNIIPKQGNHGIPFIALACPSKPTHKNNMVCFEDRCCTTRHQVFNNITRIKY